MANRIQLQTALQKPYDRILFAKEVLSPVFGSCFNLSSSAVPASVQPNKSEQAVIQSVSIYGAIKLEDRTEITCYEITLQPSVRIEHSKVVIQRYVRKLLTAGQIALVNFIAPQNKKVWRLTLVAKDSELTEQGIKEKTTHAKRYTYLLGPSETCKTAAERFESLSIEKQITFQALVNAFSVEKLSKTFFDEYTLHYQKFCDYLQESNFRKSVFNISIPENATKEQKDKACKPIRDFVKKLLGRIVFLYFVQKKGWLGASDTNYTDGMPDFIKQLFKQSGGNDAFYSIWLTKLFFETLNKERNNDDFIMPDGKKVKVPFLNGGLFDKDEYDDAILTLPAKLFHHPDFEDTLLTEKNKENARGFLDFLDAFNFTVHEDSPDDHTVAVDPEMLGHIFENLLEDNKDKGAFYTPKEIVHYMCQESLVEYLKNSPPLEGSGVVISPPQEGAGGGQKRNAQNYFQLPYNPNLKDRARQLRKAGNLSEVLFWNRVKNKQFKGYDFDRQKIVGNYIVDFYCTNCNVVIEIDGSSHDDKQEYDAQRDAYLQSVGLTVIHIPVVDVMNNLDGVMEMLFNHPALSGTPPKEGNLPLSAISPKQESESFLTPPQSGAVHSPPLEGSGVVISPNWEQKLNALVKNKEVAGLSKEKLLFIDTALDTVKICDPAIGSGAFPMGLLQEIHATKELIAYETGKPWNPAETKLNIIQNSIYGVDTEKGAVDIARLRFWLSLVVDEEKPRALPNLDYKIVVGDSLVSKFENEIIEIDWEIKEGTQGHLFGNENVIKRQKLLEEITAKQQEYFHTTDKQKLADQIRNLKIDILINQLELMINTKGVETKPTESGKKATAHMELWLQTQGWKNAIAKLKKLKQNKAEPFEHFDWKLDFPEVLNPYLVNGNAGFDIVIGNPPYIQLQKEGGHLAKLYEKLRFETFERTGDIYSLFYEKGIQLLKTNGILCYITSNKWMRAGYGKSTRLFFAKFNPLKLIDLGSGVFESATVDTNILLIKKSSTKDHSYHLQALDLSKQNNIDKLFLGNAQWLTLHSLSADSWTIANPLELSIKQKIEQKGKPLKEWDIQINYGIKTGYNEAFIIDGKKKDELIAQDPKSAEIIKPILRGRDIKRYKAEFADLWLINAHNGVKDKGIPRIDVVKDYPAIYKHLLQYESQLKKRQDKGDHWTNLRNCAYIQEFEKEKIVFQEMVQFSSFIYDKNENYYCLDTGRIITGINLKFLVSIFNSKLFFFAVKIFYGGGGLGETGIRMKHTFFENFVLKELNHSEQAPFVALVDEVLAKKEAGEDSTALEQEIDRLVYELYGLTEQEIAAVENNS